LPSVRNSALCREVQLNLAYRWFCGLGIEDNILDHSAFSPARNERFRDSDIILAKCCLLSEGDGSRGHPPPQGPNARPDCWRRGQSKMLRRHLKISRITGKQSANLQKLGPFSDGDCNKFYFLGRPLPAYTPNLDTQRFARREARCSKASSARKCRLQRTSGLPPEKWSSLMYGLWPDGGLKNAKEATHG
jgi:hypothetical protein